MLPEKPEAGTTVLMWPKIFIALAVVLVIVFAVFHKNSAPRKSEVEQPGAAPSEPAPENSEAGDATPGEADLQADKEVIFSKSLVITRRTITIDGGATREIPCSSDDTEAPTFFGFIKLPDGTRVDLSCISGYEGTVDLRYPTIGGETQKYTVASADEDEGYQWDLRSWLTKDAQTGAVNIHSVTLSSTTELSADDNEEAQNTKCEQTEKLAAWNAQDRDYTETMPTGEVFDLSQFLLPINVSAECLNSDGSWKSH